VLSDILSLPKGLTKHVLSNVEGCPSKGDVRPKALGQQVGGCPGASDAVVLGSQGVGQGLRAAHADRWIPACAGMTVKTLDEGEDAG